MRIVIIGGSGHIGTYLAPRLVRRGHEVVNVSRGVRSPYDEAPEWAEVEHVAADREAEDAEGSFGERIAGLRPDVVVDLIAFTPASAQQLLTSLRGRTGHLLHCGSIWRYGPSRSLPITEAMSIAPFGEYGTAKDAIAAMLRHETARGGLVTTSLHPGHIVGPGWHPIGPLGNLDPSVWTRLSGGETLAIPGLGAELMHHVHADDVAQAFERSIERRDEAAGEDFNIVAPDALNVRGYAAVAAGFFGREPNLTSVSWEEFRRTTSAEHAETSYEHLYRSHCFSIDKARAALGYEPRYRSEDAILESVRWLVEHGEVKVAGPLTR